VLGLGRNQISGTLPSQLGQLGFLSEYLPSFFVSFAHRWSTQLLIFHSSATLGLEGNEIEGTIPVEFSSMTSLGKSTQWLQQAALLKHILEAHLVYRIRIIAVERFAGYHPCWVGKYFWSFLVFVSSKQFERHNAIGTMSKQ
jgi:hypothetical protein